MTVKQNIFSVAEVFHCLPHFPPFQSKYEITGLLYFHFINCCCYFSFLSFKNALFSFIQDNFEQFNSLADWQQPLFTSYYLVFLLKKKFTLQHFKFHVAFLLCSYIPLIWNKKQSQNHYDERLQRYIYLSSYIQLVFKITNIQRWIPGFSCKLISVCVNLESPEGKLYERTEVLKFKVYFNWSKCTMIHQS